MFVNDKEIFGFAKKKNTDNSPILLDPHFYVDAAFYGNAGSVDYIKLFDKNGAVKFEENFNSSNVPSRPDPGLICPTPTFTCEKAFTDYFNLRNNTTYTYETIAGIYQAETGKGLTVCE